MANPPSLISGAVLALGAASLVVFALSALYMLNGLRRQARYLSLLAALGVIALTLTHFGGLALALVCSVVVLAQAASYTYFAARTALRRARPVHVWSRELPRVAVVITARDESAIIDATLCSLDTLDYPRELLQLVLIDDGSTDTMGEIARARAALMRHRLRIVSHASSGGKAQRLNEAILALDSEYVLVLDADHWVEPDLLPRMLAGFEHGPDVACVQAASAVRNAGTNLLTKLLEMEYQFRCKGVYPGKRVGIFLGSGGMFERRALLQVGCFDADMLTEDTEISYRLYEHGKRILYDDRLCTHDLAPANFRNFFNQRHRWMQGLWQAMLAHLARREDRRLSRRLGAYFVQFTFDGFGALCLCWLEALVALGAAGLVAVPAALVIPVHALLLSSGFAFSVGAVRGRRPLNLLLLPLLPAYIVLHTIPMAWALVDSYVLKKPLVWVKTERGASDGTATAPEREPERRSAPLASGRA